MRAPRCSTSLWSDLIGETSLTRALGNTAAFYQSSAHRTRHREGDCGGKKVPSHTRSFRSLAPKLKCNCDTQFEERVEEGFAWQIRRPRAPLSGNLFVLIASPGN